MVVAGKLAKGRAAEKEAAGGKGVDTAVRKGKSGLNRNILVTAAGRHVRDGGDEVTLG